jgi:hypothetical protein
LAVMAENRGRALFKIVRRSQNYIYKENQNEKNEDLMGGTHACSGIISAVNTRNCAGR